MPPERAVDVFVDKISSKTVNVQQPWERPLPSGPTMPYIVEYGSRSYGNEREEFQELEDAKGCAARKIKQGDVDFVTVFGCDGEEIAWDQ